MVVKHCPTCGRSSAEIPFYEDFCRDCSETKFKGTLPEKFEIELCKRCNRVRSKAGFLEISLSSLESIFRSRLSRYGVRLLHYTSDNSLLEITDNDSGLSTQKEIRIAYRKVLCDQCYKKANSYYEAVFQLRGDPERIKRHIEKINKYFEARNEFIAKIDECDGGYDVYVSSKLLAGSYIEMKKLKARISYTLYSIKNGKRISRNTYAIRL